QRGISCCEIRRAIDFWSCLQELVLSFPGLCIQCEANYPSPSAVLLNFGYGIARCCDKESPTFRIMTVEHCRARPVVRRTVYEAEVTHAWFQPSCPVFVHRRYPAAGLERCAPGG